MKDSIAFNANFSHIKMVSPGRVPSIFGNISARASLKDVNIPITITASIIGGESSPDVNAKLIISSGVKE